MACLSKARLFLCFQLLLFNVSMFMAIDTKMDFFLRNSNK